MHIDAHPRPDTGAAEPPSGDEARTRAIAQAVRTEIHWIFPRDRRITVIVDGDDIAVELDPPRATVQPAARCSEVST